MNRDTTCASCGGRMWMRRRPAYGMRGRGVWGWVWVHGSTVCDNPVPVRDVAEVVESERREAAGESAVMGGGL